MVRTITAAAAFMIAGSAMAVPTGATWVQVDNSTNIQGTGSQAFADAWCTYDLYVDLEAGDAISAMDFGIAGGNIGLSTDGSFLFAAAPLGDNLSANIAFAGFIANGEYFTAVTSNGFSVNPIAYVQGNPLVGAWFRGDNMSSVGPSVWAARITVSAASTFLGGQMFVSGTGPNGNFGQGIADIPLGVVNLSNAKIPTPGALALFGLAGAAATRRRR